MAGEQKSKRTPTLLDNYRMFGTSRDFDAVPIQKLIKARRFVFDWDASGFLGQMTLECAPLIMENAKFALAPYPLTWVEINQVAFMKAVGQRMTKTQDGMVGFLIEGNVVYTVSSQEQNPQLVGAVPLIYHLNDPITEEQEKAIAAHIGTSVEQYRRYVLGGAGLFSTDGQLHEQISERWMAQHCRSHRVILDEKHLPKGVSNIRMFWERMLWGAAGDIKRVLAALLLLSRPQQNTMIESFVPRSHGIVRGKQAVYLEHSVVTIKMERTAAIKRILPMWDRTSPRRHEVRGHWAQTRKKGSGCAHQWEPTDDTKEKYQCPKCGAKRWWRDAHLRGDASKGFVTKTYSVKR